MFEKAYLVDLNENPDEPGPVIVCGEIQAPRPGLPHAPAAAGPADPTAFRLSVLAIPTLGETALLLLALLLAAGGTVALRR